MSTLSDHIRRDAEHAARSDLMVEITKYIRRIHEEAKAHIATALAAAENEPAPQDGESVRVIDGTAIGREAARIATANYLSPAEVHQAIETGSNTDSDPEISRFRH